MPAPTHKAWENYKRAPKTESYNISTFRVKYESGRKILKDRIPERAMSRSDYKRAKRDKLFYIKWGGYSPKAVYADLTARQRVIMAKNRRKY